MCQRAPKANSKERFQRHREQQQQQHAGTIPVASQGGLIHSYAQTVFGRAGIVSYVQRHQVSVVFTLFPWQSALHTVGHVVNAFQNRILLRIV